MHVEISPAAADDLDDIWLYGAGEWGIKQANQYQAQLLDRVSFLAEHPALGKDRDEIKLGYKSYAEGAHLVFFQLDHSVLRVLRVLHQRMDVIRHLIN